jgi:catechol 2,3-dioxygenase-like lactoylglutathione lyase family enzyme
MEHVGIVVEDLAAATRFFVDLGFELVSEWEIEGDWVGRIIGLEGVRAENAMVRTPDGSGCLELTRFRSPAVEGRRDLPVNTLGIRHITFTVDDVEAEVAGLRARGYELVGEIQQYKDVYKLCYVRGPEGIIVELAEELG